MEKKKIIGFYDYTVILTYLGFVFAFTGILLVLNNNFTWSMICLMAAGVCDMFDGAVASTKDRNQYEKHFGIQIDSLCDLISFGVLPGLFVYRITGSRIIVGVLVCFFVLNGLIRLAFYNVQEVERQKMTDEKREVFLGIPITSSAVVMPIAYIFFEKLKFVGNWIFIVAVGLLAIGYIAGIEIKKPKTLGKIIMIAVGLAEAVGIILLATTEMI